MKYLFGSWWELVDITEKKYRRKKTWGGRRREENRDGEDVGQSIKTWKGNTSYSATLTIRRH